jgi:NADPH:quinone reductase-like Zn-dependent oxidoreductase
LLRSIAIWNYGASLVNTNYSRRCECAMRGRTVLITGASSGLGYEAALKLARLGANVVMVARDARRGQERCGTSERVPAAL